MPVYTQPDTLLSQSPEHHDEATEQLLRELGGGGCVGAPAVCSRKLRRWHTYPALLHHDMGIKPFVQIGRQRHKPFGKVFKVAAIHRPRGFL